MPLPLQSQIFFSNLSGAPASVLRQWPRPGRALPITGSGNRPRAPAESWVAGVAATGPARPGAGNHDAAMMDRPPGRRLARVAANVFVTVSLQVTAAAGINTAELPSYIIRVAVTAAQGLTPPQPSRPGPRVPPARRLGPGRSD
jgi:hypothetical protein